MESNNKVYTNRFEQQVHTFIQEHGLLKGCDDVLVAVSGGVDSMSALAVMSNIRSFGYSFRLRAIYINHGTRSSQALDQKLVHDFCCGLGVDLIVEHLEGLSGTSNFEAIARRKRYDKFKSHLRANSVLVLGHHINDSFEWSMMQGLRSSSLTGQLGIPVKNGKIIRPFMSVTREQICRYASALNLSFNEDPTNKDLKFERNYIRNEISTRLEPRYPAMLKHYVRSRNELARKLDLHIVKKKTSSFQSIKSHDGIHLISFNPDLELSGLEELLKSAISQMNPNSRGSVSAQIDKIVMALKNNKRGPFKLSGGIMVYLSNNHVFVGGEALIPDGSSWADFYLCLDEFKALIKSSLLGGKASFPLWANVPSPGFNVECTKSHDLFPDKNDIVGKGVVPGLKLVKYWTRPRNKNKKLRLRLLLSL